MRFPDDVPRLHGCDVLLRAPEPVDAPAVVEQCQDPDSIRWTTVPLDYTLDHAVEFVTGSAAEAWESGREYRFAIEVTHPDGAGRFAGSVSLRAEGERRAELAFGLHPEARGRGVMSEAVRLILDWGFDSLGLDTVIWWANRGNTGSRRVAWRAGFTFGGTARRWLAHRGEHVDGWLGTLHRADTRESKTRWLPTPSLAGDGLVLRPLDDADAPTIARGCQDPQTQHFLPFLPNPYTEADGREFLIHAQETASLGQAVTWAVADPDTSTCWANVGLRLTGSGQAEVGYWTSPDARGRGVATGALRAVLSHALAEESTGGLGLGRVSLRTAGSNTASQRVARANGFAEVGRERKAIRLGDGRLDDVLMFDLLRSDLQGGGS